MCILSTVSLNSIEAHKFWICLCSLCGHVTFASFLKHQVSLSGILWTSVVSVLSCGPPRAFTVSIALLCVGTGLSICYPPLQSHMQEEFQRQRWRVLPLWSKPAGEWPAPVQGWCVFVNIGVSWEHSTIQSTPKLQSLLFCRSVFKTWSKHVLQQCHLLTLENIPK